MKYSLHRTTYSIFGVLFLAFLFMSYSGNAPDGYTGAPGEGTCGGCHSGNALGMNGDIQITGVPSTISPNTTYPISVIVSNPDGISLSAGFSMVVLDASGTKAGTFSNPSTGSSISTGFRDYFEHSPAQPYDSNRMVTWTVDWTSPAGPSNEVITFYGVGNITDNNPGSNTSSDFVVSTSVSGTLDGTPTGADLTVSNLVGWDATYAQGEVVYFDFDINNIGNEIANGDYNIMSYLSTDAIFDASDIAVGDLVTGFTEIGTIPSVVGGISIPANLPSGNYYLIIVIDALSAIAELDETNNILVSPIAAPIAPSVPLVSSWNVTNVSCFGGNNGTANATPSGGTTPYMYAWMNGMTTPSITGLSAGNYAFTVTDANGNSVNDIAIVNEPSQLMTTVSTTGVQCASDTNGTASASVSGGILPYNIAWPSGTSTNLVAGNYVVTITDNNGCMIMENFVISADDTTPPAVMLDQNTVIALDQNGQANISPNIFDDNSMDNCSGNLLFTASQVNFTCIDLGVQNIDIEVTDDSGNMAMVTTTATVVDDLPPVINCPTIQTLGCDGVVSYSLPIVDDNCAQNITPELVSGFPSGAEFPLGVTEVVYQAVDDYDNMSTCSFEVTVFDNGMLNEMSATNASCYGGEDGTATVNTVGGTPPFAYTWSNMSTSQTISNLTAGTYTVTVEDLGGCQVISSVEVGEAAAIMVSIDLVQDDTGGGNGAIFITASGGVGGYSYSWTDENGVVVSTAEDPQNLIAGIYTATVMDADGCTVNSLQIQISTMVGIGEINLERAIHVYPNPSLGWLNINVTPSITKTIALQIFDQNGKLVYHINTIEDINQSLNLTDLQNGLYWCKFVVEDSVVVKKVVLAK